MSEAESRKPVVLVEGHWQFAHLISLFEYTPSMMQEVSFRRFSDLDEMRRLLDTADDADRIIAVVRRVDHPDDIEQTQPPVWLREDISVIRVPAESAGHLFWPVAGTDTRSVAEPLYPNGRYGFSDHHAEALAPRAGESDDRLYQAYLGESSVELAAAQPRLAHTLAFMRRLDSVCDIAFAEHFERTLSDVKYFTGPVTGAGPLFAWLANCVLGCLAAPVGWDTKRLETLREAVRYRTIGFRGNAAHEFPVHPVVAASFGLSWAQNARFRWGRNLWTHREAMLRAIRWEPWLP
jgi:hypothetical protein